MRVVNGLLIGVVLLAVTAFGGEETVPVGKDIVLAPVGEVDAALVQRVGSFVERLIRVPVKTLEPRASIGTLEQDVKSVADKGALITIALVNPSEPSNAHGISFPEMSLAAVNVASLRPADGNEETYGRRIEKQTVRSIAMLLKLGPCPNPHCALCAYSSIEELDRMGRGLCPPCLDRARVAAEARGAELIKQTLPMKK